MTLNDEDTAALWQLNRELEDTDLEGHINWTTLMLDWRGSTGAAPTPWHDEMSTRRATSEMALDLLVEANQAINTGWFMRCECAPIYVAPHHYAEWLDRMLDGQFPRVMPIGVNGEVMNLLIEGEIRWTGDFRHGQPVFVASSV